jgi:TRAP-type C4-dicarboxylate transport system permease small subunit
MNSILNKTDLAVKCILRYITILLFIVLALLLFGNVLLRLVNDVARYFDAHNLESISSLIKRLIPFTSFHWLDEIVELSISSLTFYGAAAVWAYRGHFSVGDWISKRLPNPALRIFYKTFVSAVVSIFLAIFFWYSLQLCLNTTELSTVFQIPKWAMYMSMPISSFIMLTYSLSDLIRSLAGIK